MTLSKNKKNKKNYNLKNKSVANYPGGKNQNFLNVLVSPVYSQNSQIVKL